VENRRKVILTEGPKPCCRCYFLIVIVYIFVVKYKLCAIYETLNFNVSFKKAVYMQLQTSPSEQDAG